MYPTDRKYSKEHEWLLLENGSATVGITDFAQQELGDIVYVELPEQGKEVRKDEILGTIESVKAVSEIYAPVGGTVIAANDALTDAPESVNSDPHGAGWYCKLQVTDPAEIDTLLDATAYQELIGS